MAQSLFKALCQQDSQAEISVLAPAATFSLLARMPEVKEGILSPIAHGKLNLSAHRELGNSLKGKFDQAIILPGSLKSSLIPFFASVPKRSAWRGEMRYGLVNDMRKLDKSKIMLMVNQFLALAAAKDADLPAREYPSLRVDEENRRQCCQKLELNRDKKILAFCPGAEYGPAKQWPAKHFAELAKKKISEGWQVWIFGGPKDVAIAEQIQNAVNHSDCLSLAGKTSLVDAIDLLSLADTVVTNDSGLMHVSCAVDRKVVVIYGSSTPQFTPPLSDSAKILSLNLSCSPCFERQCPLKHLDCLNTLSPDWVNQNVDALQA